MKKLTLVLLTVLLLQITACGKEFSIPQVPSTSGDQKPQGDTGAAKPFTVNTVDGGDNNVDSFQLTYYKKTVTRAPVNGWITKTYDSTGYCVEYNGNTYCWSDGIKTLQWVYNNVGYGPYTYTYWNLKQKVDGGFSISGGNIGTADFFSAPRLMTSSVETNVPTGSVSEVLAGTAVTVTCTEADGIVTCDDFTIDTNQTPR